MPVPPLQDTYIVPISVHQAYATLSRNFDTVHIGRDTRWVLGTDTAYGGIRLYFSGKGEMLFIQVVRDGKDHSQMIDGDLTRAMTLIKPQEQKSA